MRTSKPHIPLGPPVAEGGYFASPMRPPAGFISLGHLLHLIRSKKTETDFSQRSVDEADEPLRRLLLNGEVQASIWTEEKFEPISAGNWDDASFVLRACSGWLAAGWGLIVLPESVLAYLSVSDQRMPAATELNYKISIYLEVMLAWSKCAAGDVKVWTKEEIENWLRANWPNTSVRPSKNELSQMAGLCRDPEDRKGGNKKNVELQRRKKR
ncbi:hypothetical protein ABIE71_002245 [Bradyrhizobium diazoefficiens]